MTKKTGLSVADLWRYPVKSMQGERLTQAKLGLDGLACDRAWALFDANSGVGLTARSEPNLLFATASVAPSGELTITLPDGTETIDDDTLSAWLQRDVVLRRSAPGLAGTYEIKLDDASDGDEAGKVVQWTGAAGSFHDSTRSKVSLATTAALGLWDARRFRINIQLDGPASAEDDLVGKQLTAGTAQLDVTKQIDRCVMVTRPQPNHQGEPSLDRDLSVLKTINADRGGVLSVGALITEAGSLAIGDEILLA